MSVFALHRDRTEELYFITLVLILTAYSPIAGYLVRYHHAVNYYRAHFENSNEQLLIMAFKRIEQRVWPLAYHIKKGNNITIGHCQKIIHTFLHLLLGFGTQLDDIELFVVNLLQMGFG